MTKGTKTTLILLGILIVIAAVFVLVEKPFTKEQKNESATGEVLFPNYSKDKVVKITTKKLGTEISLEKKDSTWTVNTYKADQDSVNTLLDKVKDLKKGEVVSQNANKQVDFQVDQTMGLQVIVRDASDKDLANFYIGKIGPDWMSQYLRLEGSNDVFLVKESLSSFFDKSEQDWRDKTILALNKDNIKAITLITSKEKIILEKSDNKWQMTSPNKSEVDSTKMDDILTNVSSLNAASFVSGKELADIGLATGKEKSKVVIKMNDDSEITLLVGNEENSNYYVKKDKEDTIYQVAKDVMDKILVSSKDLKKS